MNSHCSLVLCTCPDQATAESLARTIIESSLAACVNLLPGVQSIYRWEGRVELSAEILLLIKTARRCLPELEECIRTNHPYEVPEIIALDITSGYVAYLDWVLSSTLPDFSNDF